MEIVIWAVGVGWWVEGSKRVEVGEVVGLPKSSSGRRGGGLGRVRVRGAGIGLVGWSRVLVLVVGLVVGEVSSCSSVLGAFLCASDELGLGTGFGLRISNAGWELCLRTSFLRFGFGAVGSVGVKSRMLCLCLRLDARGGMAGGVEDIFIVDDMLGEIGEEDCIVSLGLSGAVDEVMCCGGL